MACTYKGEAGWKKHVLFEKTAGQQVLGGEDLHCISLIIYYFIDILVTTVDSSLFVLF